MYGISLNIVYNESGHKNMANCDYIFIKEFKKELYFLGDNTSINNQKVPVLSPITANCIGNFSHILTNNLNLMAPI